MSPEAPPHDLLPYARIWLADAQSGGETPPVLR